MCRENALLKSRSFKNWNISKTGRLTQVAIETAAQGPSPKKREREKKTVAATVYEDPRCAKRLPQHEPTGNTKPAVTVKREQPVKTEQPQDGWNAPLDANSLAVARFEQLRQQQLLHLQQQPQQRQQEPTECSKCLEYKTKLVSAHKEFSLEKSQLKSESEVKIVTTQVALNEKTEQVKQLKVEAAIHAQKIQELELERKGLIKQLEAAHYRVEDLTNKVTLTLTTVFTTLIKTCYNLSM